MLTADFDLSDVPFLGCLRLHIVLRRVILEVQENMTNFLYPVYFYQLLIE